MRSPLYSRFVKALLIPALFLGGLSFAALAEKQVITALTIPLADHYAGLVALEKYGSEFQHAELRIELMKNWDLLRARFQAGDADMAFVMSPLAIDMFHEKPHFRWIGLMHRDGNALAVNHQLLRELQLSDDRSGRKPDAQVAQALAKWYRHSGSPTWIGVPHQLSTHNVVLYQYLKNFGLTLSTVPHTPGEVLSLAVPPPESPVFLRTKSNRAQPAAFEQSLPWADVVETEGFGKVAWYSKDVLPWPNGHVECIALAANEAIHNKQAAVREVMHTIHRAGLLIEQARIEGGGALEEIVRIVRKHIPAHTRRAIIASLDPALAVINYRNLNVDKAGLQEIMRLAVEGRILKSTIDVEQMADDQFRFSTTPSLPPGGDNVDRR